MHPYIQRLSFLTVLLTLANVASAATISLSNISSYNNTIFINHPVGSPTSSVVQNPVYASAYASTSYLSVSVASSVDGSSFTQLGIDYAVAEAISWFGADMLISEGTGNAQLNIDALYNEISTNNADTTIYGEQRIRIYDENSDLVFAYLRGVSDESALKNILLSFDTTYRFEMTSTAYSLARIGSYASNQREFSASLSATTAVPVPASILLFISGMSMFGILLRIRNN